MVIGLAGKSCSGKNFAGDILKRYGFTVWDLDEECAKIRKSEKDKILALFGTYDAKELGKIVFSDEKKLRLLEGVIYPELKKKIEAFKYDLVLNGATLYRGGFDAMCSFLIYVDAPYEVRLERAKVRDRISEEDFAKREAAQTDVDYKNVTYRCPVFVLDSTEGIKVQDLDRILNFRQQS